MSDEHNMADAGMEKNFKASFAKLIAVFEPAAHEKLRVRRGFTGNRPNAGLGDVCESPAPERETLEKPPKDVKVTLKTAEKDSLVEKESVPDRNISVQPASAESGHAFTRLCDEKEHERMGAKPKTRSQTASKQHRVDLDSEYRQSLHENEVFDETLLALRKGEKQGPSNEQCVALEWEIAELKRRKGTRREEIARVESKLEEQAVKQRLLQLEALRNGLCEEEETDEDKLAQLRDKLQPETFEEMCLERLNNIEKVNLALKSQTDALQGETDLAKSRRETQDDLEKRCSRVEAENRVICYKNKMLQDELEEINSNIKVQWRVEYSLELMSKNAGLKRETGALQESVKQAKSKLELLPAMTRQILEMEGVRNGLCEENETGEDKLAQLKNKLEPETFEEMCLERINNIKKEIAKLRSHTDVLQGQLERGNAKLQQQMSLKERCLELEAESRRVQDKNELLRREILQTTGKLFHEKTWKHKLKNTQVLKRVIDSENKQLLQHKQKLEKALEEQKTAALEYKQQLQEVYTQRNDNIRLHQDVHKLVTEIGNHKLARENYKDMAKKDAQVKAKNKKLEKTVERLQKELEKLGPVEVELENFPRGLDEEREKNCNLHNKIRALNEEITSKEMQLVRLKSLKAEREWILQRRRGLNHEISGLRVVRLDQLTLHKEKKIWDDSNERLLQHNRQLHETWEKLFVETLSAEVLQDLIGIAKTQGEEMDQLNQELTQEIEEFRTSAE